MEAGQDWRGHRYAESTTTTIITSATREDLEKQRHLEEWERHNAQASYAVSAEESRARPVVALLSLVLLFLSSNAGISLFVLALVGVVVARGEELPSRVVVFAASLVGSIYALLHVAAARTNYRRKEPGAPQIYGNYKHAAGLLLVRVGVPIWMTAVVTTALAIARIDGSSASSFQADPKQMSLINLIVAVVGLVSNLTLLFCVETSSTPFATSLISKTEFLRTRGRSPSSMMMDRDRENEKEETTRINTATTVKQIDLAPLSFQQHRAEHRAQHRALNSVDRANGAWPINRSVSNASSVYSTQTYASRAAGPYVGQAPPARPSTVLSEVRASVLPMSPPGPMDETERSPVHMSWRPPSHHSKRSIDYGSRQQPPTAPPLPVESAGVHGRPELRREPSIPRLSAGPRGLPSNPAALKKHHRSLSSGSRSVRSEGTEEKNAQPAMPQQSPPPKESMDKKILPMTDTFSVPQIPLRANTIAGPASRQSSTPSPRSRSLRSHPPELGASTSSLARKPASSGPLTDQRVIRPSTAPGLPRASTDGWESAQRSFSVKRKPVGQGKTSRETDLRPKTADEGRARVYYYYEDSDTSDDEAEQGPSLDLSRTKKRLLKQEQTKLKRSNTVNQNFSRPLTRSKSLASLNSSTGAEKIQRTSTSFFNGEFRYYD